MSLDFFALFDIAIKYIWYQFFINVLFESFPPSGVPKAERSEAELRHEAKRRAPKGNFFIDFSTSGHFVALRSK